MPILTTLIADAETAVDKLRAHLSDLGHEVADDATALIEQAKAAAGPLVQAADDDVHTLAGEVVADAKDVASSFDSGTAPAADETPTAN